MIKYFAAAALMMLAVSVESSPYLPEGAERIPQFEFSCPGLTNAIFADDGTLSVGTKLYKLEAGFNEMMLFSSGASSASLRGRVEGDILNLDNAVLTVDGKEYRCTAQ